MNTAKIELEIDTTKATNNVHELRATMQALAKDTNAVPWSRVEWFVLGHIITQSVIGLALLGIAVALLRGH
jgi:hypothetical protein